MGRNLLLLGVGALLMLAIQSSQPARSAGEAKPTPSPVATLDMAYVFQHCRDFTSAQEQLSAEVASKEAELKQEKKALELRESRIKESSASEDTKELKEELIRDKTEFGIKLNKIKDQFHEREEVLYYEFYQRVLRLVEKHSQQHGIRIVLKNSQQEVVDNPSREQILKIINNQIVYQDQVDITQEILAQLNQKGMTGTD